MNAASPDEDLATPAPLSFDQKAVQLRRIQTGDESYGEGSPGAQGVRFYLDQMLEEAVKRALPGSDRPHRTPVPLLISLSGYSPLTTILAYELLRPERLLVISSEETQASIDVIGDYLVAPGRLRQSDFMHRSCTPTDPHGIYRIVKEELDQPHGQDREQPYAIIDITGGRKVMSAAAALAAWQLKLDLCYIESAYDPERRQPLPGSDRLMLLGNPTAVFGEQEMDAALQLFASGAFGAARERYENLCNSLSEPGRARFMRALADLYEAWCDLDLDSVPARIEAVELVMLNERHEIRPETADLVEGQLEFLRRLAQRDRDSFVVCFYVLGRHYQGVGRRDFAALLFYRTIEDCLAARLEQRADGFSCHRPDYRLLADDVGRLEEEYVALLASLGKPTLRLPDNVSFLNGAALLNLLNDELVASAEIKGKKGISGLEWMGSVRNKSVLAHGLNPIDAEECEALQRKSQTVLRAYRTTRDAGQDLSDLCQSLRFIQTDH